MYVQPLNINKVMLNQSEPDQGENLSFTYYDTDRDVFSVNSVKVNTNKKLYAKFDVKYKGERGRATALYDSGADVSVITKDYLKTLFPRSYLNLLKEVRPANISVTGFGSNKIQIEGSIYLPLQFHSNDTTYRVQFLVLNSSVKTTTPVILGMNCITKFGLEQKNEMVNGFFQPYLSKQICGKNTRLYSSYLSDQLLYSGISKEMTLAKGQTHLIKVYINAFNTINVGTKVVTSQPHYAVNDKCILVDHALSTVGCDETGKYCLANVFVNQAENFIGKITVEIEYESYFETLPITKENIEYLSKSNINIIHDIDRLDEKGVLDYDYEITEEANIFNVQRSRFASSVGCDPDAINNNVKNNHTALSDQRCPIPESPDLSPKEMAEFNDPQKCINLNMQPIDDKTFDKIISESRGYGLPEKKMTSADVIDFSNFSEEAIPFIKEMFIEKYPETIPLHSLDCGDMSSLLGKYRLRLKEDAKLPKQKKVFFQSSLESSHMKAILEFMCELDIIAPVECTAEGEHHQYSSPAFLISRKDKEASARLIVDFSGLNSQLHIESCTLPNVESIVQNLRHQTFYSNIDISNAFNSISLTDDSAKLTLFSSPQGSYYFRKLGTGLAGSPEILSRIMHKMIHYEVCKDKDGKIMWVKEGEAKMEYSKLCDVYLFYDDILICSPWIKDYETSKKNHFKLVETVIKRLHTHKAKISINKSKFFVSKLLFVGWKISRDFIQVDEKRVEKIRNFNMPNTVKAWRQFAGTVNSIRPVLGWDILDPLQKISPLTSDKSDGIANAEQAEAFQKIIKFMGSAPLCARLVDPNAPKIVFSDSGGTAQGSFCSVLCQVIKPENRKKYIPSYYNLADKNHLLAIERKHDCIPLDYIRKDEGMKDYLERTHHENPPETAYLDDHQMGLKEDDMDFSLSKSLDSLFKSMGLKETLTSLGAKIVDKELSKELFKANLKHYVIGKDKKDFQMFEQNVKQGKLTYDKDNIMIELIAKTLQRCIYVFDAYGLTGDTSKKIKTFNHSKEKPPFYLFLYPCKNSLGEAKIIVRPAYISKQLEYDLKQHRGSLEIVAWFSKAIPSSVANNHIMEKECFGILCALHSFRKLIGSNPEVLLITDSRPLYFLHHGTTNLSSVKVSRWSLKMLQEYNTLEVSFITSRFNLADILTREFNISVPNSLQFKMPCGISHELEKYLPDRRFTLKEWVRFINNDIPNCFEYEAKEIAAKQTKKVILNKIDMILNDRDESSDTKYDLEELIETINFFEPEPNEAEFDNPNVSINEIDATNEEDLSEEIISQERNVLHEKISNRSYSLANTILFKPLTAIDNKLSFYKIGIAQKKSSETKTIYTKALTSIEQTYIDGLVKYSILNGVLFRTKLPDGHPQIMITSDLLVVLVLSTHLKGAHMGREQMNLNLTNYYCKGMTKMVKSITERCLSCFICNQNTNREMLNYAPCSSKPFESVGIDFLEDIPSGLEEPDSLYKDILIVTCLNTYAILAYPLTSRKTEEWLNVYYAFVHQVFKPKFVVCDNSKSFKNMAVAKCMVKSGSVLVDTVSYHPNSKGFIEINIKKVRHMLKKHCALFEQKDWILSLSILTNQYNCTRQVGTKYAPFDLIFGMNNRLSQQPFSMMGLSPRPNPILKNSEVMEQEASRERKFLSKNVKSVVDNNKKWRNSAVNEGRFSRNIVPGDLVFIKRRVKKTKLDTDYVLSIWRVLYSKVGGTVIVYQLCSGYITGAHLDDLKKYSPLDPAFDRLPQTVKTILQKPLSSWLLSDLNDLAENTNLTLPRIRKNITKEFISNHKEELKVIFDNLGHTLET